MDLNYIMQCLVERARKQIEVLDDRIEELEEVEELLTNLEDEFSENLEKYEEISENVKGYVTDLEEHMEKSELLLDDQITEADLDELVNKPKKTLNLKITKKEET